MNLRRIVVGLIIVVAVGIIGLGIWHVIASHKTEHEGDASKADSTKLVGEKTLQLTTEQRERLKIGLGDVSAPPPVELLRLPGSLGLDPNRLLRIHARFPGEIIRISRVSLQPNSPKLIAEGQKLVERPLQFLDRVEKNQVLAVVWSKEIGEKKSELVDALSKKRLDKEFLDRLMSVREGVVPEKDRLDAKRNYEQDLINVAKAERTLRSWKLTEEEIEAVEHEAEEIRTGRNDPNNDRSWAELEIRSPISGVILEKNVIEGAIVDTNDDLFKISDTSLLQVLANAYEEHLPLLSSLPLDKRHWRVELKSDPRGAYLKGDFSLIGKLIDPQQHTVKIMGWLDNVDGKLAAGQFITASVEIPVEQGVVLVPTRAILEEGDRASVFVRSKEKVDEFTLLEVEITRRERTVVHVRFSPSLDALKRTLQVGDQVVVSGVITLASELRQQQQQQRLRPVAAKQ